MDRQNVRDLRRWRRPAPANASICLAEFAQGKTRDVPDPYYDGPEAFASVYRMIREASEALAKLLEARASAPDSGQASSTM